MYQATMLKLTAMAMVTRLYTSDSTTVVSVDAPVQPSINDTLVDLTRTMLIQAITVVVVSNEFLLFLNISPVNGKCTVIFFGL